MSATISSKSKLISLNKREAKSGKSNTEPWCGGFLLFDMMGNVRHLDHITLWDKDKDP